MFPVLSPEGVTKHQVKTGDTLESIAKQYKLKEWQAIALYNWATDKTPEINRALIERIGCSHVDGDNAHLTVLRPPKNATPEIEIPAEPAPKLKAGLATNKNYDVIVKPLLPATAIGIRKLDKWFVPGVEDCTVEYQTEGLKSCADKVAFEVYGSNYCDCSDWSNGLGKYTVLPVETPVYRRPPDENEAEERDQASIENWKGEAFAAKGILSVKTGMESRVLNAAFSPYTASLRYYKNEADAKAALVLLPFWPKFKEKPTEQTISGSDVQDEAEKVVIKWTNAAQAHWGELIVKDKDGKAVYQLALPVAQLASGAQQIEWKRKYNRGVRNSRHLSSYLAADGPYSCDVATVSGGTKTELTPTGGDVVDVGTKIKVTWSNGVNYASATLDIADRDAKKVYSVAAPTASGNQQHEWDGMFNIGGATNSRGGAEYLGADGGYQYTLTGVHEQAPLPAVSAPKVVFSWNNAIDFDKARLEVRDKSGKLVFSNTVKRERGVQSYDWNKRYNATGVKNSGGGTTFFPADAPYTYKIIAEKQHLTAHAVTAGNVTVKWSNAAVADQGLITVTDKNGAEVFRADLAGKLTAGAQSFDWDKRYTDPALNSRKEPVYVAGDGPYVYKVITFAGGAAKTVTNLSGAGLPQAMTVTLKWTNADLADRGALIIADAKGQLVYTEAIPTAKLAKGPQETVWNCGYRSDAWNSDFRQEYCAADGAYVYKVITFVREPDPASLKVEWLVKNTDKLECGHIRIVDGSDRLVFLAPLIKAQVAKSASDKPADRRSFTWDGKYSLDLKNSKNGDSIIAEDMPYRVQVQAHKDMNQPDGLALASMHTEVRLYVHPETPAADDLSYYPGAAAASLGLGLGPLTPGDPPAAGNTQWYQYKLAEFGFHPGPVNGVKHSAYTTAMKEFKRSVPKKKTGANFERLAVNEAEDADTKAAIENIRASDKRGVFGDPAKVTANNDAPDLTDAEVKDQLPDAAKEMIVWADDRQYYTDGDSSKDDTNTEFLKPPFNLGNPRAGMVCGDNRPKLDAAAIPRPWIPLQAGPRLLGKGDGLYNEVAAPDNNTATAMRRAIGPLRMDWTFSELAPDLSHIDTSLVEYDTTFVRSRYYVGWAIDKEKAKHKRKDTNRDVYYTNAKEYTDSGTKSGGIRPSDLTQYYKAAFGSGNFNLLPWGATPVDATESIATVIHDHLIGKQKEGSTLYAKLIGTAGAYFTPSRVAGDGYRVKAELRFEPFTNYDFPNLAVLKARYAAPPRVHSAALRVWRRSSFRGYMCWGPATTHWSGGDDFINAFRTHYRGAHVYFVHEGGAAQTFPIADVFDPANAAHQTRYDKIIKNNTSDANLKAHVTSLNGGYVWPWGNRVDLGYHYRSTAVNVSAFLDEIWNATWRKWRSALLLALVREVEKKGFLRGHLMVEFQDAPGCRIEQYECNDAAKHKFLFLWRAPHFDQHYDGTNCPICGPGKTLTSQGGWNRPGGLGSPAVGGALGATWLFRDGGTVDRLKLVWVHEVGHHRHLEHAADAPGGKADLHDSEQNASFKGWDGVSCNGATPPQPGLAMGWDRRCIMSYSDCWYGESGCLCGRCLLRNRGWKVTALGFPGRDKGDE